MKSSRPPSVLDEPLPLFFIGITTLFAVIVSVISLLSGWMTIFQNLFYIPIILACIYYTKRGFWFSVLLSCVYLTLMLVFSRDPVVIEGALIRVVIFILVAGVITFITGKGLQAEEALRESEERYSALFDNNFSVALLIDPDTAAIVEVNDAACRYYGYSREQMLRQTVSDLNRLLKEKVVIDLQRAKHKGKKHFFTTHYLANGQRREVEVYSGPITLQAKPLFYSIIHDVTDHKRAEEALQKSEERLALTIGAISEGLWDWDVPTGNAYFAPYYYTMLGYEPGEFPASYDAFRSLVHPDDIASCETHLQGHITHKDAGYAIEFRMRAKDGSYRWILSRGKVVTRDSNGMPIRLVGTHADITGRKRAEKEIQDRERFLNQLIETIPNPIYYKDRDGIYTSCNSAFAAFLGVSREQVIGRSVYDLSPRELADIYYAKDRELIDRQGKQTYEAQVRYADGSLRDVFFNKATLVDEAGNVNGIVGIMVDITDRKRSVEALKMANRKLNLLGSITRHDILNQLLVVNGYLELLGEKFADPEFKSCFSRIMNATAQIEAMIRFTKEYEQVGVHAPLWQDACTIVDMVATDEVAGEVRIQNEIPPGTEVFSDPLIIKVFYNLVENAVRHGERVKTVRFSGAEHDGAYCIICKDDGVGVPADEKEKVFERGFGKNTGFGLFLAREILGITGITIRETGEPLHGAQFEIMVPKEGYRSRETGTFRQTSPGSAG